MLVHGYDGSARDLDHVALALGGGGFGLGSEVVETLQVSVGDTHDGVERGAVRVWRQVMRRLNEKEGKVERMSVVAHSLGGLYARYVVRLLADCFVFETVTPVVFATFATPHLGVRRPQVNPVDVAFQSVARWVNRTTAELCLEDDAEMPLLRRITDDSFLDPLRRFAVRVAYANVWNDVQVPHYSASISDHNPYASVSRDAGALAAATPSASHPSITAWSLAARGWRPPCLNGGGFAHEPLRPRTHLTMMLSRLSELGWERYDTVFATLFAHEQIVNKRSLFSGADVVSHFCLVVARAAVATRRRLSMSSPSASGPSTFTRVRSSDDDDGGGMHDVDLDDGSFKDANADGAESASFATAS